MKNTFKKIALGVGILSSIESCVPPTEKDQSNISNDSIPMLRIQDDIKCDLIKNVSFSEKLYIWAAEQEKKDIESVLGKEVNIYINKNKPDDKICYIDTTEQNPLGKKQVNYMLCKQVFTKDMLKSIYLSKQELAKSAGLQKLEKFWSDALRELE